MNTGTTTMQIPKQVLVTDRASVLDHRGTGRDGNSPGQPGRYRWSGQPSSGLAGTHNGERELSRGHVDSPPAQYRGGANTTYLRGKLANVTACFERPR